MLCPPSRASKLCVDCGVSLWGTVVRSEPGASRSHSECWQGRFPHTDGKNERTEVTDLFVHGEVSKFAEFDVSLAGHDGQIVMQEQCANTREMGDNIIEILRSQRGIGVAQVESFQVLRELQDGAKHLSIDSIAHVESGARAIT